MAEAACLALLWVAFAGSHMILSSVRLRPRLVGALGELPYQALFSLVALACFVPLVWLYFDHKHAGPLLWAVPVGPVLRWFLYVGNGVALVLAVAGLVTPSAASVTARSPEPRGVHFLTRHALFMGAGLWGALHLVPNGYAADLVFFGGFPLFALLGCWHQDRRKLATQESYQSFFDQTPFLPFTGRTTLRGLRELSLVAWIVGIGGTVLLRTFHQPWFGP